MIVRLCCWLDRRVLRCRWHWFCAAAWGWQIARDAARGAFEGFEDA